MKSESSPCHISVIIPIYNGSKWIDLCFESILLQTALGIVPFEICICNDGSNDDTVNLLGLWKPKFLQHGINWNIYNNSEINPRGVGYAKNRAISLSTGNYLCFQDVDDVMLPNRILKQYKKALELPDNTLIGCQFERIPKDSTSRYTRWANNLTHEQLTLQIYTANGPTIIMPTWFCHKSVYDNIGGFDESGKGTPEDLLFFYKHLEMNGKLYRVDNTLLQYYHHPNAVTLSIDENTIWDIRIDRIQKMILIRWDKFTIWNAGKQGRKFYKSLSDDNKKKVIAFCDVDAKKIDKNYVPFDPSSRKTGRSIQIKHFKEAVPPIIVCVKLDMTNGDFEEHLALMRLEEGKDYVLFS